MKRAVLALGGMALVFNLTGAARADDASAVTAEITSAAAHLTSFVIQTSIAGTTGVTTRMTFVRPARMKSLTTFGTMTMEMYLVDGVMYMHSPAIGWRKMAVSALKAAAVSTNIAETLKSQKITYLANRQENGTTVGAFRIEAKLPQGMGALSGDRPGAATAADASPVMKTTCTFDRATYLMRTCTNSAMTMSYSNFNDPANVVDLPAEAKTAVPFVFPTPETALPSPAQTIASPAPDAPVSAEPAPPLEPSPSPSAVPSPPS